MPVIDPSGDSPVDQTCDVLAAPSVLNPKPEVSSQPNEVRSSRPDEFPASHTLQGNHHYLNRQCFSGRFG